MYKLKENFGIFPNEVDEMNEFLETDAVYRKIQLFKAIVKFNRSSYRIIALNGKIDPQYFTSAINGKIRMTKNFAKIIDEYLKTQLEEFAKNVIKEKEISESKDYQTLESIVGEREYVRKILNSGDGFTRDDKLKKYINEGKTEAEKAERYARIKNVEAGK